MGVWPGRVSGSGRALLRWAALPVCLAVAVGVETASASPIRSRPRVASARSRDLSISPRAASGAFLNPLRPGRRALADLDAPTLAARVALQAEPPYFAYLRQRRSLNPARFDRNHPRIGPLLAIIPPVPTTAPLPPTTLGPQAIVPRAPTAPEPPLPQLIPEPPGVLIALVLLAAGILARRRTREHG